MTRSSDSFPFDTAALREVLSNGKAGSDYMRGARDMLVLLGLLRQAEDGASAPAGEVSEMVLASLAAHIADGIPVLFDWDDLDAAAPRGVDILRALEQARLQASESPSPARVVNVVQGVIKARRGGEDVYLMQYDTHAHRYQPLGGKQDPGDADTAAALRRELMEELPLSFLPTEDDCTLTLLRADWRTQTISATYGILTAYAMDFYAVSYIGFEIVTDEDTRWLTRAEIGSLVCADGRAITSAYQQGLGLELIDALPPVLTLPG